MKKLSTDKKEFQQVLLARIRSVMQTEHITQAMLIQKAQDLGYDLRQSTLSKLLSEGASMNICNLIQIAATLNIDLNDLFSEERATVVRTRKAADTHKESHLIRDPDSLELRPYLGIYHTYFFPTVSTEDRILEGTLEFKPSSDGLCCEAFFSFETGKFKQNGKPLTKDYTGELALSTIMGCAYCSLCNEAFGEISYMMFRYIPILQEQLCCCTALVLTASAGSNRMPTAHRMILSRRALTPEEVSVLRGHLYLNEAEILISEQGLRQFMANPELDKEFVDYFSRNGSNTDFLGTSPVGYYHFDESLIRGSFLPSAVKSKAISLIRQYSAAPMYNKIGTKCDELVYRYITESERQRQAAEKESSCTSE